LALLFILNRPKVASALALRVVFTNDNGAETFPDQLEALSIPRRKRHDLRGGISRADGHEVPGTIKPSSIVNDITAGEIPANLSGGHSLNNAIASPTGCCLRLSHFTQEWATSCGRLLVARNGPVKPCLRCRLTARTGVAVHLKQIEGNGIQNAGTVGLSNVTYNTTAIFGSVSSFANKH
jgi:hypothetical protein